MTAAPSPTPQLYTPDDLSAAIVSDFKARAIAIVVEVGEWNPELHRGAPRIVIDFGDGDIGEPAAQHYTPGAWWPVTGTTKVARVLLDDAQRFVLWIHAPAVSTPEGEAAAARRATDQLLRQTMRAIRRNMASPFRVAAKVRWPTKDDPATRDYPGFVRGSLCRVEILLASPILDDAFAVGTVTGVQFSDQVILGGVAAPPETSSESTP